MSLLADNFFIGYIVLFIGSRISEKCCRCDKGWFSEFVWEVESDV